MTSELKALYEQKEAIERKIKAIESPSAEVGHVRFKRNVGGSYRFSIQTVGLGGGVYKSERWKELIAVDNADTFKQSLDDLICDITKLKDEIFDMI